MIYVIYSRNHDQSIDELYSSNHDDLKEKYKEFLLESAKEIGVIINPPLVQHNEP